MKLRDATVLLTGASGGIGAAAARALVEAGARVLLVGRDAGRVLRVADRLARAAPSGRVEALAVDLMQARGRAQLRDLAIAFNVNVLVNNAGVPCFGRVAGVDDAQLERVIATNLVAPIALTRDLLPHLARQPSAIVLNVGSTLGRLGLPGYAVYAASKFGLRGFTESLRRELAGSSVSVLYLAPRATRTRFNDASAERYNRATRTREDAPERVAHALCRAIEHPVPERQLGFPERVAVRINGLVPALLDGAFATHRDFVAATALSPTSTPGDSR
jgi:short-subunit dehydrogenase